MTNEEAIKMLTRLKDRINWEDTDCQKKAGMHAAGDQDQRAEGQRISVQEGANQDKKPIRRRDTL